MQSELLNKQHLIVFGGSFDPPHQAHVALPQKVMQHLNADGIVYIPVGVPPHKPNRSLTPTTQRLAMLDLALQNQPHTYVWTDEIDRAAQGDPTYTIDTLRRLGNQLDPQTQLRLLIGGDQLRDFDTWKSYQTIEQLAEPVVMVRPPDNTTTLLDALPAGFDPRVWQSRLIEIPAMNISSTLIRQRVANGQSIAGWVDPKVEKYILEQGLYQ